MNKDNFMCDLKISNPTDRPIAFELLCNSSLLIYWAPKMDILTPGKELSIHIHRRTMNEENKERLLTMLPPGKMQFLIKAAYTPPGEEKPEKWVSELLCPQDSMGNIRCLFIFVVTCCQT